MVVVGPWLATMASQAQRPIQAPSSVSKGTERGSIVPGDGPLTRNNGVVFKALDTVSIRQYLSSLVTQISGANIISASRISNGRIAAYLSSREAVIGAVENGLTYDGTFIELTPLVQPTTRLTLSNVYPEIPNEVLVHNLSSFCKVVSQVRPIHLGFKEKHLSHIMSFRRQVHVLIKPNIFPPEHISFSYLGNNYRVFLSTESVRCFACGEYGHISRACKRQGTDDIDSNEANPLNPPPTFVHNPSNRKKSDPKHPPKVSKPSLGDADRAGPSSIRASAGSGGSAGPAGAACAGAGHAAPVRGDVSTRGSPGAGAGSGESAARSGEGPVGSSSGAGGSAGAGGPAGPAGPAGPSAPAAAPAPEAPASSATPPPSPLSHHSSNPSHHSPSSSQPPVSLQSTHLPSKPCCSVWGSPPPPSRLFSDVVSKRKSSPQPSPTNTPTLIPLKKTSPPRKLAWKVAVPMTVNSPSLTQVLDSQTSTVSTPASSTNDQEDMWEDSQATEDEAVPECISNTKGPLSSKELVNFLASVKTRKKPAEVAKRFTANVPGLVKQLKPLRTIPLINRGLQQRITKLIRTLDKYFFCLSLCGS